MVSQIGRGAEMRKKKENTHAVKPPSADPRAAGEGRRDMGQEGRVVAWAEGRQSATGGEDPPGHGESRRTRHGEMRRQVALMEPPCSAGTGLCPAAPALSGPQCSPGQRGPHPCACTAWQRPSHQCIPFSWGPSVPERRLWSTLTTPPNRPRQTATACGAGAGLVREVSNSCGIVFFKNRCRIWTPRVA